MFNFTSIFKIFNFGFGNLENLLNSDWTEHFDAVNR